MSDIQEGRFKILGSVRFFNAKREKKTWIRAASLDERISIKTSRGREGFFQRVSPPFPVSRIPRLDETAFYIPRDTSEGNIPRDFARANETRRQSIPTRACELSAQYASTISSRAYYYRRVATRWMKLLSRRGVRDALPAIRAKNNWIRTKS